jgi:RHS repeat-associated protein
VFPRGTTELSNHRTIERFQLLLSNCRTLFLFSLLLPLLLFSTATFAQAATLLYVNPTDPTCQGHAPCYQTIQAAVDAVLAGDTIRIQAGTYQEQVNISGKNNVPGASEADRILLEADPAAPVGSVVLTGAVTQCTNGYAIRLQQSRYITIRGLTITGAGGQAISLMGGNNQNTAIHIERNRLWSNGSPECNGGITIARGNPDTLILNNEIFANGRNGITFIDADGGPHFLINNTIHRNAWSGVNVARTHEVHLVNNLITGNGTASGSTGGRFGVKREGSTSPQPAGITLQNNLICGNRLGEIDGPALDATDSNNLTPTGSEGPGVTASPGCEVSSNVYANLNGLDTQPNTADDDFTLAPTSPAIDRGMDPRTLGLNPSFNPLFEADFSGEGRRPRDGNGSGTAEFDMGALEAGQAARPTITNLNPNTGVHGQTINLLTVTGERLGGATGLTFLKDGNADPAITATNLATNPAGTELTATITIAATAALGSRIVTVTTPEGTSDATATSGNTFTVLGQITLVPNFMSLVEGQSGGLTVQLSAPAPTGGLTVTLESAAPGIATVPASVKVAAGATSAPTSVTGVFEGTTNLTASATGFASGQTVVTVLAPVPTISSFNPSNGKVTTTVVLSGTGFRLTPSANTVRFTGPNSTWVAASVSAASSTSLTVTVPQGAITGPLQVSTSGGTATSAGYFIVLPTQDFTLLVEPSTATTIAGTSVNLKVSTVTTGGYTGLTTLSTGSLPTGVTASFNPPNLGPNTSGLLTLTTSGSTPSSASIEVRGTATIEGAAVTRTGTSLLNVQAAGQTVLTGQVRDENDKPLAGVMIKLGGSTITTLGTTDSAGNFLVSLSVAGPQVFLIDGSTANTPTVSYASIPVTVTIQAGVVNTLGFTPHLHAQPVTQPLPVAPAVATPITFANLPDFQVTIPAGVQIIGWDGQPNTQIGVRAVPLDRLAVPPIPAVVETDTVYMFGFGKVGGGTPTQPIPVTFPNTIGASPGQQLELWYYNEALDGTAPNQWELFGLGTVSNDGKLIVSNPGVGMPRFCCGAGFPRRPPPPPNTPPDEGAPDPCPDPRCGRKRAGDPVELSSGIFLHEATDLTLLGRIPIVLTRIYRTNDPTLGPFGIGTSTGYDAYLRQKTTDMVIVFLPGNYKSRWARQPDGSFGVRDKESFRSARLTRNPDSTWTLRYKDGRIWQFNSAGWLISQQDRNGNELTILRDSQNRISALREPGGRELAFSYSGSDTKIQSLQDPLGRRVTYSYDGSNRLTQVTDPAGGTWQYTYDASHRILTVTNPRNILQTQNTYNAAGRVATQTLADGGETRFDYTVVAGTIAATQVTDPLGVTRRYRFAGGYPIGETDGLGQAEQTGRAPGTNLVLAQVDRLGKSSSYMYDSAGNLTHRIDPLGQVWSFTYEPTFNQTLTSTDPLTQTTTFSYDARGNLTAITDPLNHTSSFAYNASGDRTSVTDPLNHTTMFEYDNLGNLIATVDPLGNRTERTYDSVSRLVAVKDPKGAVTRFSYNALDRLVSTTDPLNGTTTFTYDPMGNLSMVTDAKGQTTTHTYDPMNRLATRTDALNRTEGYTYDLNGNLRMVTDRKSQVTTHTYDAQNRRIRTDFADGSFITYTYDPAGNLVGLTDSQTGTITRSYDTLNRLVSEVTPQGAMTYAYDQANRRTQMQVNGLAPVTYGYDANSRLTQIQQGTQAATLSYDAANRRMTLSLPNGITVSYTYDTASRLIAQTYTGPQGLLGDLTYTYDANGNRVATGGTWARTGIPGSIATSSYDPGNEQLAFSTVTQTFDANGNLLTQTDASGTTIYTWDARNRLIAITGPTMNATFAYDALGRRISKTINGVTTAFHHDGLDAVRENGAAGEANYLRTLAIDEALSRADASGTQVYLADILGSIMALTDASGIPTTEYTYEPFGASQVSGTPSVSPFQFTGRENDSSGLYYNRARYYSPFSGRFLQEDPLGLAGGVNLYTYGANNPINLREPLGLQAGCLITCSCYGVMCACYKTEGGSVSFLGLFAIGGDRGCIFLCFYRCDEFPPPSRTCPPNA